VSVSVSVCLAVAVLGGRPVFGQPAPFHAWLGANAISTTAGGRPQATWTRAVGGTSVSVEATDQVRRRATGFGAEGGLTFGLGIGFGLRLERVTHAYAIGFRLLSAHPTRSDLVATDADMTDSVFRRTTTSTDIMATWVVPTPHDSVLIRVFGGPTIFYASHETVSDAGILRSFNNSGTINTVTLNTANVSRQLLAGGGTGYNAGADAAFFFSRYLGVGAGMHFNKGVVYQTDLEVGRVTAAAGLRFRY